MARKYGLFGLIGDFIFFWVRAFTKYQRIKENEEKRATSVKLGVRSIVQSIIAAAALVLCAFGMKLCLNNLSSSTATLPVFTVIGLVLFIGIAIVSLIQGMLGAMMYWIYQLKLNKKPIGYAAMAVWIVCLIAAIAVSILILASI